MRHTQRCRIAHKSWAALAHCIWPYAEIRGDGAHAIIYSARQYTKMLVLLFATKEQAREELQVGHGGRRYQELYQHRQPGQVA